MSLTHTEVGSDSGYVDAREAAGGREYEFAAVTLTTCGREALGNRAFENCCCFARALRASETTTQRLLDGLAGATTLPAMAEAGMPSTASAVPRRRRAVTKRCPR